MPDSVLSQAYWVGSAPDRLKSPESLSHRMAGFQAFLLLLLLGPTFATFSLMLILLDQEPPPQMFPSCIPSLFHPLK